MRIISKFRDYYDAAGAHYRDATPVYVRHTVEHWVERDLTKPCQARDSLGQLYDAFQKMPEPDHGWKDDHKSLYWYAELFGFCGQVYPLWVLHRPENGVAWSPEEALQHPETPKKTAEYYRQERSLWNKFTFNTKGFDAWEGEYGQQLVQDEVFRKLNAPAWILQRYKSSLRVVTNPQLTEYRLHSVIDMYQAYQQLDQYLGNQLAQQQDPVPERSQELIRDSKGFDDWSFKSSRNERKIRRGK